jgi:hypothetical protein
VGNRNVNENKNYAPFIMEVLALAVLLPLALVVLEDQAFLIIGIAGAVMVCIALWGWPSIRKYWVWALIASAAWIATFVALYMNVQIGKQANASANDIFSMIQVDSVNKERLEGRLTVQNNSPSDLRIYNVVMNIPLVTRETIIAQLTPITIKPGNQHHFPLGDDEKIRERDLIELEMDYAFASGQPKATSYVSFEIPSDLEAGQQIKHAFCCSRSEQNLLRRAVENLNHDFAAPEGSIVVKFPEETVFGQPVMLPLQATSRRLLVDGSQRMVFFQGLYGREPSTLVSPFGTAVGGLHVLHFAWSDDRGMLAMKLDGMDARRARFDSPSESANSDRNDADSGSR